MIRFWAGIFFAVVTATAFAGEVSIPLRDIAAGTFYVQVDVSGLGSVEFLVDTGSGYTVINTEMLVDLEKVGAATYLKQLTGIMADGSQAIVPLYHIPEIRVGSCVIRDVEVAVFAASTRPILGMRSLSKVSPFTFSTNPPALSLSRCDTAPAVAAAASRKVAAQPVVARHTALVSGMDVAERKLPQ